VRAAGEVTSGGAITVYGEGCREATSGAAIPVYGEARNS